MKLISFAVLIAACGLLASCATSTSVNHPDPTESRQRPLVMTIQMKSPGEEARMVMPRAEFSEHKFPSSVAVESEFIYSATYQDAVRSSVIPIDLRGVKTGLSLEYTTDMGGDVMTVRGKAVYKDFDRFVKMSGESGEPLVDGEGRIVPRNKVLLPIFRTYETPILYRMKVGTSGSFEIDHPKKGTKLLIALGDRN